MNIQENIFNQSLFIKDWIEENIIAAKLQYPNANEEDLRSILTDIAKKYVTNHKAHLFNDYQDDLTVNADLLTLYDWYHIKKPIAAGNGTFFYNQDQKTSPILNVIDGRISSRKHYQHIRDQYISDITSYEYTYYDMMQMEAKVKINAIYGAFGAKTFQLYNVFTAASTTGTAQSLISTTTMAFEAFLSNSIKFKSLGEFITLVNNVLVKDKRTLTIRGLKPIRDKDFLFEYIKTRFSDYKEDYTKTIRNILNNIEDVEELTRLYYINNIFALIENEPIKQRISVIFEKVDSFRNPNDIPEPILEDLEYVWDYCDEFVFYNHAYVEQINRIKHDIRNTAVLIDTDSDVINLEPWMEWSRKNVWNNVNTNMDDTDKEFCSVNTIAYLVTKMTRSLLNRYASDCHVLERYQSRINTKNEFYFPKLLLANVKKRYIAHIKLKEGKQVDKIELKGHDFKKAGVNAIIEDELMDIIRSNIINHPSVNVIKIMEDVVKLENKIRDSIKNKERTYLNRMNCKVAKAYADPYSQGAFTGPLLWNILYPDNEILIPDKLDVVYINITKEKDLDKLKDFPKERELIRKHIFHGGINSLETKGVKYLALPNDDSPIPDWVLPIIDLERIVTRNIGTFYPVLKALTFSTIRTGDNEYFSNILNV